MSEQADRAPSDEELAELRGRHGVEPNAIGATWCKADARAWPCVVVRLLDAYAAQAAELRALREAAADVLKGGVHEGACDEGWACGQHVMAIHHRQKALRAALAGRGASGGGGEMNG